MLSIDTIKFSLYFPVDHLYKINTTKRDYKKYTIIPKTYSKTGLSVKVLKRSNTNINSEESIEKQHFLHMNLYREKIDDEHYKQNVYVDFHVNNFLYDAFQDYYVKKEKIFNELYSLLEEILNIKEFDDLRLAITEIHVANDIVLKHDVKYYLKTLKFKPCRYYYHTQTTGNNTITIFPLEETKFVSFESRKVLYIASVNNKKRKLDFRSDNVEDYNILRFEYIFKDVHRRNIGIKSGFFTLSNIYDIGWVQNFKKYFLNKYLHKKHDNYTNEAYQDLFGRQDNSQEEIYNENQEPINSYVTFKKLHKISGEDLNRSYSFGRFYEVNFKKYLKKKYPEINTTGLDLYNELYLKARDIEGFKDEIPNVYRIYHKLSD